MSLHNNSVAHNNSADTMTHSLQEMSLNERDNENNSSQVPDNIGNNKNIVTIPRMPPATRDGKEKVSLITNDYLVTVAAKIVYRYDIQIHIVYANGKSHLLSKGSLNDANRINRNEVCVTALRIALEAYRLMREGEAIIYDGAQRLFTSFELENSLKEYSNMLHLSLDNLPPEIRRSIHYPDATGLSIEINPPVTGSKNMDISNYREIKIQGGNLSNCDQSYQQFFDMLTSAPFLIRGEYIAFGGGRLFPKNSKTIDMHNGQEIVEGINKGIILLDGKDSDINLGLVIDSKSGQFFKAQPLLDSIREFMGWRPEDDDCHFDFNGPDFEKLNEFVKGLCLTMDAKGQKIPIIATGISPGPARDQLSSFSSNEKRQPLFKLEQFSYCNPKLAHWPAVSVENEMQNNKSVKMYYPIDALHVAPNQRVPLHKQKKPPRPPTVGDRFKKIRQIRQKMDEFPEFGILAAFGVTLSKDPLNVEGIRRERPEIAFGCENIIKPKEDTGAFSIGKNTYIKAARVEVIVVAHDCDLDIATKFKDTLKEEMCSKDIKPNWILLDVKEQENEHEKVYYSFESAAIQKKEASKQKLVLLMYIDDKKNNDSHGYLKYYERQYLIHSQHITTEVATKLTPAMTSNIMNKLNIKMGGVNYHVIPDFYSKQDWLNNGKSLVFGYDVNHPTGMGTDSARAVSTVGYSFNGADDPEYFMGGFHYQEPRKEEVSEAVLDTLIKNAVSLFTNARKNPPENIFILRDGVDNGQFQNVLDKEFPAILEAVNEYKSSKGGNLDKWQPKFVLVIVTKRHNRRFFLNENGTIRNPKPGTTIDMEAVCPDLTQFYMQAHNAFLGTACLPCYYVFHNDFQDVKETQDKLQSFFLALSFNHQISPGSISMPEPLYQADAWGTRGKTIWDVHVKLGKEIPKLQTYNQNKYKKGPPFDFEKMTSMYSYRGTPLELFRVNA